MLLQFILDKCDIAGFWEIDLASATFHIGATVDNDTLQALQGVYMDAGEGFIWIKDFLLAQCNWPLRTNAPAHRGIARCLHKHNSFIEKALSYLNSNSIETLSIDLLKSISNSKGNSKSKSKTTETKKCITRGCKAKGPASRTDGTGQSYYLCEKCSG